MGNENLKVGTAYLFFALTIVVMCVLSSSIKDKIADSTEKILIELKKE